MNNNSGRRHFVVVVVVLAFVSFREVADAVDTSSSSSSSSSFERQLADYLKDSGKNELLYLTEQRRSEVRFPRVCPLLGVFDADEACAAQPTCNSTNGCSSANTTCCFNGCVYACVEAHEPSPPVFDWEDESRRPVAFDDNNDEDFEIECTTSGLHSSCPEGHVCQILDKGDPLRAISNKGVCLSLEDLQEGGLILDYAEAEGASPWTRPHHNRHRQREGGGEPDQQVSVESVFLPGGCMLTTEQYHGIEEFIKGQHFTSCVCSVGTVLCSVPQQAGGPSKRRRHSGNHRHRHRGCHRGIC